MFCVRFALTQWREQEWLFLIPCSVSVMMLPGMLHCWLNWRALWKGMRNQSQKKLLQKSHKKRNDTLWHWQWCVQCQKRAETINSDLCDHIWRCWQAHIGLKYTSRPSEDRLNLLKRIFKSSRAQGSIIKTFFAGLVRIIVADFYCRCQHFCWLNNKKWYFFSLSFVCFRWKHIQYAYIINVLWSLMRFTK